MLTPAPRSVLADPGPDEKAGMEKAATATGDLYIRSVRFSPDGRYLATGAEDERVRVRGYFHSFSLLGGIEAASGRVRCELGEGGDWGRRTGGLADWRVRGGSRGESEPRLRLRGDCGWEWVAGAPAVFVAATREAGRV
jgi:hypothetical protein